MAFIVTETVSDEAARSWQLLADRLAAESDDQLRANLDIVAQHVVAEVRGDIPALMATLVPEPVYEYYGAPGFSGPKGRDAVIAVYEASMEAGQNRMEFELCRVAADHESVITEGIFRQAFSGASLIALSLEHSEPLAADGWYLTEYPALVVWVISPSGLIEGERVYLGGPPEPKRKLAPGECPHLGPVGRDNPETAEEIA
jgi:limonene-1,2-epoxide hydrolase